jgi:uncharacterized protein (TIGR03437 family)
MLSLLFCANLLFSGTDLIKSTDGGRTWIDIDPGLPQLGIVDLQIALNGSRLYALAVTDTPRGPRDWGAGRRDYIVLSSLDSGRSWRELEPFRVSAAGFAVMAIAPSDPETVYVAIERTNDSAIWPYDRVHTILKSTDGGRTAIALAGADEVLNLTNRFKFCSPFEPPSAAAFLAVHPTSSTRLFWEAECWVGDDILYSGFLSSADAGSTWQLSWKIGLTQLLAEPDDPSLLYARHHETLQRDGFHLVKSTDGGNEWSFKLPDVSYFTMNPADPAVFLASKTDGTLWMSADRAETWDQLGNWLPFDRMVIHPGKPSVVLAQAPALLRPGISTGDIFKSRDGGASWTVLPTGLDGFSFVFDPSDPDTIYGISAKRVEARLRPPYIRNLAGGSTFSPGSLFSVYGEDLADLVTFDGQPADLLFISRRQINGRIPNGLKPGEVAVEILREPSEGPAQLDRQSIMLSPAPAPVIIPDSSGAPRPFHLDSGQPVTDTDPALPGERIGVYSTGLGEPATSYVQFWPTDRPSAFYPVLFANPVAAQPGVYEVGIEVPRTLGQGSYLLLFWGGRNFARLPTR